MHAAARSPEIFAEEAEALRALLQVLAVESGELAAAADGLQVLFGQLMAEPPHRPADALEQAQTLDGLVQRLQGLESFLEGLCASAPGPLQDRAAEVAARLRLTSQARRFSPADAGAAVEVAAGDCDLF